MKLPPRRVSAFLRDPGAVKVVLLYGDDAGLIRERAKTLATSLLGGADDPFRLVTVDRADEILPEASGISLGGGRRVVRVPDANEAARGPIADVLNGIADALVILEAPRLSPARSRLFKLIETSPDAAAIACYSAADTPDASGRLVRSWLAERDVTIEPDALSWLISRLGADTALSRAEVEKLALYIGSGGRADLASVEACISDAAGLLLEDALFAATAGDCATADRALERALAEGTSPVTIVRAGLAHLQRLERAALTTASGASPAEAARAAHLFFRRTPSFIRALQIWSPAELAAAADLFFRGERAAKRSGVPSATLCRHLIAALATQARQSGGATPE